ncbi:chorismate mutase [Vagococcus hydrophili]|uniref:Chorismate mutase n=1 Tax=Vagococcus hydrophili TaxID=2714947 RepID=A0A6G8ASJ2_9ENTE|nr:chorismate mutase [Vagococcus hydrophili]QIL47895.1 chorismate mutase [Vagococcus hydrophili]
MLKEIREEVNQIDQELVRLLEKRYACVDEIVRIKKEQHIATLDSTREQEVLKQVADLVENKDYEISIMRTFQDIMDRSKEYQKQNK